MLRTLSFILGLFPFFVVSLFSQDFSYRQLTTKDGLVQMQTSCLFQDSRGYLWIGTKVGVSKFDGEKFENLKKKDGLLASNVYQILEDQKGNIWFCHSSGLSKYDGKKIVVFPNREKAKIYSANIDRDGVIRLYSKKAIYKFKDGNFFKTTVPKKYKGLVYSKFWNCFVTAVDSLGLCLLKEDSILTPLHKSIPEYYHGRVGYSSSLERIVFYCRASIKDNINVYLLEQERLIKICELDVKTGKRINITFDAYPKSYYSYSKGALRYFDKEKREITVIQKLNFDKINDFLVDKENNIWLASEEGLIQFFGRGFQHFNAEPFT